MPRKPIMRRLNGYKKKPLINRLPIKPLRIATIFSFAANEEQNAIGEISDETFDTSAMDSSAKEFLDAAIREYNSHFKTNFSTDSNGFQNYYRDLAQRVKNQDIDLLIVVGCFNRLRCSKH